MKTIYAKLLIINFLLISFLSVPFVSGQVNPCPAPQGLNANGITSTSATLNWNTTGAMAYQLSYCPAGIANWISVTTTIPSAIVSNLLPSTTYGYCVRSVCSNSNNTSYTGPWSVIAYFTTPSQAFCHASFTFSPLPVTNPPNQYGFQFTNTSTGISNATTYLWDFGDNTISNLENPTHYYTQAGTYNVCLTITSLDSNGNILCTDTYCHHVTMAQQPCHASFTFIALPITNPNNQYGFQFTSTSTGIGNTTTYQWDFGDNTTSNLQNPVHYYTQPGTYYVCLTITTPGMNGTILCTDTYCQHLTIAPVNCNALFTYTPVSSAANGYQFTSISTGINNTTMYFWDFGDSTNSTLQNPIHYFTHPGTYQVCLTITTVMATGVNCTDVVCQNIVVNGTSNCDVPANLAAANIAYHKAFISWSNTGAMFYQIRYRPALATSWIQLTATTNSIEIIGLASGTLYEIQVRSVCAILNGTHIVSAFSPSLFITTLSIPSPFISKEAVLYFYYDPSESAEAIIDLFDVTGLSVLSVKKTLNPGINEIGLDYGGITNGMYVLRINTGDRQTSQKVMVIR